MIFPLIQGTIWNLALHGWKYWNRAAALNGESVGAKARRWWYRTNNWKLPAVVKVIGKNEKLAKDMSDVSFGSGLSSSLYRLADVF